MEKTLLSIGVMTGNSLDGVDSVLTAFHPDGGIQDLCWSFAPFDDDLYQPVRALQRKVSECAGDMKLVAKEFSWSNGVDTFNFDQVHDLYLERVARAVRQLIQKARHSVPDDQAYDLDAIDCIGLHGQTCDHNPPSRAGGFFADKVYTVQIGNGQRLADLTGITVVNDFRSDDIMHGGEGAPLAPLHNQHLAKHAKSQGCFPLTFCNAGNTGNVAHVTHEEGAPERARTLGWDTGPFNHYTDYLMRTERQQAFDEGGNISKKGTVNLTLLKALFDHGVTQADGSNYLLHKPPKSGDPNYYTFVPDLVDQAIPFEDRLRTAAYFSAYAFVHSLSLTPPEVVLPGYFAIFGGGWHNSVVLEHFRGLLSGEDQPLLPEHQEAFKRVQQRVAKAGGAVVEWSNALGFDGQVMEARIFADMARCRLLGKAFSTPDTTGAHRPVVGGIIRFPDQDVTKASALVRHILKASGSGAITLDNPEIFDPRWSRASAGWAQRMPFPHF